jgi:DNA-binding response OmpR family regulator
MARAVTTHGGLVLGPAASVQAALALLAHDRPDAAIVDAVLGPQDATDVARRLRDLQVPFVVATGGDRARLPAALRDAPYIGKPYTWDALVDLLTRAADNRASNPLAS